MGSSGDHWKMRLLSRATTRPDRLDLVPTLGYAADVAPRASPLTLASSRFPAPAMIDVEPGQFAGSGGSARPGSPSPSLPCGADEPRGHTELPSYLLGGKHVLKLANLRLLG